MRFEFATATRIVFGEGTAASLPELVRAHGTRPLLVTGGSPERTAAFASALSAQTFAVAGEPTVDSVREGAARAWTAGCDVILSIGGGIVAPSEHAEHDDHVSKVPKTSQSRESMRARVAPTCP